MHWPLPPRPAHWRPPPPLPSSTPSPQNLLGTAIALAGVFAYSQVKRLGGKGKGDKAKAE